jgi:hypothetical protein
MTQEGPNRPEPEPLKLGSKTTSIVFLTCPSLRKSAGGLFEVDDTSR